jgi:hypothetical protein
LSYLLEIGSLKLSSIVVPELILEAQLTHDEEELFYPMLLISSITPSLSDIGLSTFEQISISSSSCCLSLISCSCSSSMSANPPPWKSPSSLIALRWELDEATEKWTFVGEKN